MAKQSAKSLVIEFMDRFFDNKGKASKFFDLEDVRNIIALSNEDLHTETEDAEFILNLVSYGMMAGYMKGYKVAVADQKKGVNELDKPLKYAKKKDIKPSDITGKILAKRMAEVEKVREEKAAAKKTATKKATVKSAKKTEAKKPAKKTCAKKATKSTTKSTKKSEKK